jgi:hypothetical protein
MRPLPFLRRYVFPFIVSLALVLLLDALTNNVTAKRLYDSNLYIGLAEHGFDREFRLAPFVYRYAAPFLAGGISQLTALSTYKSFKLLVYLGGIGQLMGVFFLTRWLAESEKGAYAGMAAVAFSLYNLKYPLFDVYRPDILAYPIILLGAYFAFKGQFLALLVTTMLGLQFREFAVVPLLAWLVAKIRAQGWKASRRVLLASLLGLSLAIGLPRLLIPVMGDAQDVHLSPAGIGEALYLLSLWQRDLNLLYILLAYFLPCLILYRPRLLESALQAVTREQADFLLAYTDFVLMLAALGGADLERFGTYFFLPLAIGVALLAKTQPVAKIILVLVIQILFNRIWLPFPVWDFDLMVDFYGGWSNVITPTTLWRYTEAVALAALGNFIVHRTPKVSKTSEI